MESFEMIEIFRVKPKQIYFAWLDSKSHTQMTGSEAFADAKVKGRFSAWEGYISGVTIELVPNKKIVQQWRTTEFPDDSPDSMLEINLEEIKEGTRLILKHSDIPDGQSEAYKQGWKDYYFEPMKEYFTNS